MRIASLAPSALRSFRKSTTMEWSIRVSSAALPYTLDKTTPFMIARCRMGIMLFMNLLSTIIRQRDNVRVYMLGNTVNKFCPYFTEMGLKQVPFMEQGTIDIYRFGEHGAIVAVEYCSTIVQHKASNKYFCFDNQNLQMITGGKWELAVYPHLPCKYKPQDVLFVYYIKFNDVVLHGLIRDEQGRKMSKSLGNGIDPMEVIEKYGADALRWFLMTGSTPGQDTRFSYDKMDAAWNFINKIWIKIRIYFFNII